MDPRLTGLDLKTSLSAILDLVLPRECVVCGRNLIPQERHICISCLADLPETHFATLGHNPMADKLNGKLDKDIYEPYAYAAALFYYDPESGYSNISKALKYGRNIAEGRYFARMLGERLSRSDLYCDVDLVVPVPLHWTRQRKRGYNQAEIIAREVAAALGAKCGTGLLKRSRRTRSQATLSPDEKAGNVSGAFSIDRKKAQELLSTGISHILIADDVFTTGSTACSCRTALRREFGPEVKISVATLGYVA